MSWQPHLLKWYGRNKRDLPWRRTKDPYAIWVSEIMLQQTTVEAVIPYYERFLKRFPSVEALAKGPEEDVLTLWSGLGYYSRARNLFKAADLLKRGNFPSDVEGLIKLPGIGRYTAGAISSIAFGKKAPIVDGNVIRVLARLYAIEDDPKSSAGQKIFWKKADEILPDDSLGDFNQALMELGAMVCSPEKPACLLCPVEAFCKARVSNRVADFPRPKKKTEYRDVRMVAAVIKRDEEVLLVQRPGKGLLKGMWELPMGEGDHLPSGWPVEIVRPLKPVKHSVLNRRLTIYPFLCRLRKKENFSEKVLWVKPSNINELPTSSMNRKILLHLDKKLNPDAMPKTKRHG